MPLNIFEPVVAKDPVLIFPELPAFNANEAVAEKDELIACEADTANEDVNVLITLPLTEIEPDTATLPLISNTPFNAVSLFIPTTDCDTNNALLLYCPIRTVLSENASITGKPAVVLTENNEPDNESSTENRRPDVPSTVNTPDPLPRNTSEEDAFEDDIIKEPVIFPIPIKGNAATDPKRKEAVVAKDAVVAKEELPNKLPVADILPVVFE